MRLNNRAADNEAHPHSIRFGGEEWFKYPDHALRVESFSVVRNIYLDHFIGGDSRAYSHSTVSVHDVSHRFQRIHDQIQYDLLDLHLIAKYLA